MSKKYYIIILILITSCVPENEELTITDFSKPIKIIYKPHKFWPYSFLDVKVKGYVSDTIKLVRGEPYYDLIFIGKLDTIRKLEYYGEAPILFTLEPYRATKGKVEITIGLIH